MRVTAPIAAGDMRSAAEVESFIRAVRSPSTCRSSKAMRIASVVLIAVTLAGCSRHPYEKFFSSGEKHLAAGKYQ